MMGTLSLSFFSGWLGGRERKVWNFILYFFKHFLAGMFIIYFSILFIQVVSIYYFPRQFFYFLLLLHGN